MNKIMILAMVGLLGIIGCDGPKNPVTCFNNIDGKIWVTTDIAKLYNPALSTGMTFPCPNCQCLPIAKTN